VGFPVADLTHLPFPVSGTVYLDSFGDLAEIDYTGSGGQTAVYRKSPGTRDGDATVAPTMGLLPMPMKPIISTCAGTEDEPANWASECMRPMVSVMP
jgi:hypothetical protein